VARWLGLLIGINVEAVALIVAAYFGGTALDARHPIGISWVAIFMLGAVVVFLHSFWAFGRAVWREAQKSDSDANHRN
jgi:hypothetical protein